MRSHRSFCFYFAVFLAIIAVCGILLGLFNGRSGLPLTFQGVSLLLLSGFLYIVHEIILELRGIRWAIRDSNKNMTSESEIKRPSKDS